MKLYDSVYKAVEDLTASYKYTILNNNATAIRESDGSTLIFAEDTAFELGAKTLPGIGGIVYSDEVKENKIILIGKDLNEIKKDLPYARITMVRVNDEKMGEGNVLYQNLRKIDYVRYHVNPEGFMVRISSMNSKESLRVSKKVSDRNLGFANLGKLYMDKYLAMDMVEAVTIIFVTDPDFDYNLLKRQMEKSENITKALDHLLNKVKMDCHSCNLQVVCNEVEQLTKEEFKK